MVVGEKRRFWIPANLAYGETPRGGRPGGMLVFDVELFEIAAAPEPPAVPEDVAAAPEGAETTASGLASRVIEAGTGSVNPTAESTVRVHYTGWQTNGEMFDSSVTRGNPATFPLRGVIAGWTEGFSSWSRARRVASGSRLTSRTARTPAVAAPAACSSSTCSARS